MRYMPRLCPRRLGMLGVDERQRDERAAVLGPGRQRRAAGRAARRTVTTSVTGPARRRVVPDPQQLAAPRRGHPTACRASAAAASRPAATMRRSAAGDAGRTPAPARRGVPNRLVTSGNAAPFTLVNSSAGPPAAITRRWISATSSTGSTGAAISIDVAVTPQLIDERSQVQEHQRSAFPSNTVTPPTSVSWTMAAWISPDTPRTGPGRPRRHRASGTVHFVPSRLRRCGLRLVSDTHQSGSARWRPARRARPPGTSWNTPSSSPPFLYRMPLVTRYVARSRRGFVGSR